MTAPPPTPSVVPRLLRQCDSQASHKHKHNPIHSLCFSPAKCMHPIHGLPFAGERILGGNRWQQRARHVSG